MTRGLGGWRLFPVALAPVISAVLSVGVAQPAEALTVKRLQQVSGQSPYSSACGLQAPPPFKASDFLPPDTANEPTIAANPTDPRNMIAVWHQDFGLTIGVASTRDGGRTWKRTVVPGISRCSGGAHDGPVDPAVAFGPDGTAYLTAMAGTVPFGSTTPVNAVLVHRSTDGGRTWSGPAEAVGADSFNDHPWVTVDRSDPRRVYVAWADLRGPFGAHNAGIELAISTDGGRSFAEPRTIYAPSDFPHNASNLFLRTLDDGTLVATFGEFNTSTELLPGAPKVPRRMLAISSTDHGESWSPAVEMGSAPRPPIEDESGNAIHAELSASLATGPAGAIATWSHREEDGSAIMLSRSRNGTEWTEPTAVIHKDHGLFDPTVSVARNGHVAVYWYDLGKDRPGDEAFTVQPRIAISRGGRTHWREVRLARPFDMLTAWRDPRFGELFVGDYMGMAGLRARFAPVFIMAQPRVRFGMSQAFVALASLR